VRLIKEFINIIEIILNWKTVFKTLSSRLVNDANYMGDYKRNDGL
jgi:hypothetical protein